MIKHHELHIALDAKDVDDLALAGLHNLVGDTESCHFCGAEVGYTEDGFVTVAIVLNDEDERLLCMSCVRPLVETL